ncbi:hypothetical protein HMPREF9120_01271 [Neisseria sp. oral taxon 020 str. F0370]|nr:hypothetical protein HMPREF9120_01271 [Neisseria sp. oral taxon 020 str. F0370]
MPYKTAARRRPNKKRRDYIVKQNRKDTRQQAADSMSNTTRRSNAVDFLFCFTITPPRTVLRGRGRLKKGGGAQTVLYATRTRRVFRRPCGCKRPSETLAKPKSALLCLCLRLPKDRAAIGAKPERSPEGHKRGYGSLLVFQTA